jgi:hypothetical protein
MFGNKNAGLHETTMRLGLHRRERRAKKVKVNAALPIPRKGFEVMDRRETYFAVASPIRWTL